MAKQQISFRRVSTMPTTGLVKGTIYFDVTSGTINVATSETAYDEFGYGVRNAIWANQILTLTKSNGEEVTLNFSDVASASALNELKTTVNNHGTRLTTAEGKITTLQEEMDAVEAKAAANEGKLAGIESTVAAAIDEDVLVETTRATKAEEALGGRVDTLNTTVSGHTTAIADLQAAVGEGGSVADAINAAIDALAGSASDEGTYVDVAVTTENGEVKTVTVDDSALVTKVNELNTAISDEATARTTAITEINNKIGGSYSASATVDAAIKAAKAAADAAQADIDAFLDAEGIKNTALDTLKEIQDYITTEASAADELVLRVAANETDIDNLEAKVDVDKVSTAIATAKSEIVGTLGDGDAATLAAINDELDALASADATNLDAAKTYAKGLNDVTEEKVSTLNTWKSGLNVTDTAVSGNYVSAVSQSNGKITVTRAALPDYSKTYDAFGAAAAAQSAAISAAATDATEKADAAVVSANSYTDTAIEAAFVWAEF